MFKGRVRLTSLSPLSRPNECSLAFLNAVLICTILSCKYVSQLLHTMHFCLKGNQGAVRIHAFACFRFMIRLSCIVVIQSTGTKPTACRKHRTRSANVLFADVQERAAAILKQSNAIFYNMYCDA